MHCPAEQEFGNTITINLSAGGGHFESASYRDNGCLSLSGLIKQLHLYLCLWGDWVQTKQLHAG